MSLYKYFPQPSSKMAELWALISIENCAVLEYGPAGTTHFSIETLGQYQAEQRCDLATTDIDGSDIALGINSRIEKSIDEIINKSEPKYLFVCASSLSAIIGTDIQSICNSLQSNYQNTKLIPLTSGGLKGNFNSGLEDILYKIVENMVKQPKYNDCNNIKEPTFNIIGSCIDDCYFNADSIEITRILKGAFNLDVQCILTSNTSVEQIEQMAKSSINIVIRKEGLKTAEYLKEKYNIPYVYQKPYGLAGTQNWIRNIEGTLGIKANNDFIQSEIDLLTKPLMRTKQMSMIRPKSCLISGNYDTVKGVSAFVRDELKFKVDACWTNSKSIQDVNIPYYEENEWIEKVKNFNGNLILSDAIAINLANKDVTCFQISNPNLDRNLIYPFTPLVGFRGTLYLLEIIQNIKQKLF